MMKYPTISHDNKKCVKLKLADIEYCQSYYSGRFSDIEHLADKFKVTISTIRYWVDEEYRNGIKAKNRERNNWLWHNDPEYRKKHIMLKAKRLAERKQKDPKFLSYSRKQSINYNQKNLDKIKTRHKLDYAQNRDRMLARDKNYYQAKRDEIRKKRDLRTGKLFRQFMELVQN